MKYLFQIILLFISGNTIAQSNFKDGYFIGLKGDTVKGLIDYRYGQYTAGSIGFKGSQQSKEVKTLTPADIREFYVSPGITCLSYTGKVSMNKNHFPENDAAKDTSTKISSLFLKLLISGPNVSLYVNTNQFKTRYFYQEKNDTPVELIYYEYAVSGQQLTVNADFIAQLTLLFNKYNNYNNNKLSFLQNTAFTESSLESAMLIINANKFNRKDANTTAAKFFIGASAIRTSSTVNHIIFNSPTTTSINYSPQVNLGYDIFTNTTKNFMIRGELSFSYIKPSYSFTYSDAGANAVPGNVYSFNEFIISIAPQVLYNFYNTPELKVFVGAGISFNFFSHKNDELNYNHIINFNPYTVQRSVSYDNFYYPLFVPGFPIEAGFTLNNRIEISFNYSFPISTQAATAFKPQTAGVGIAYLF